MPTFKANWQILLFIINKDKGLAQVTVSSFKTVLDVLEVLDDHKRLSVKICFFAMNFGDVADLSSPELHPVAARGCTCLCTSKRDVLSLESSSSLVEHWASMRGEAGADLLEFSSDQQMCREHRLHKSKSIGC